MVEVINTIFSTLADVEISDNLSNISVTQEFTEDTKDDVKRIFEDYSQENFISIKIDERPEAQASTTWITADDELSTGSGFDYAKTEIASKRPTLNRLLNNGEYTKAVNILNEIVLDRASEFFINITIDKNIFEEFLSSSSESNIQLWYNTDTLKQWMDDVSIERIGQSLFHKDKMPVFIFINGSDLPSSSYISFRQIETVDKDLETNINPYLEQMQMDAEIIETGGGQIVISPGLFDSAQTRHVFRKVFLYSCFAVLSSENRLEGDELKVTIGVTGELLQDRISFCEEYITDFEDIDLTNLFSLYENFTEIRRDSHYRFWRRAIAYSVDSFNEIPENRDKIARFYELIEEDVFEQKLDELNDVLDDIQSFLGSINQRVSEEVAKLTDELRNVVFALLAAIISNIFLVVRWSDVDRVIPFSILISVVVVGVYLPVINSRIEDTNVTLLNLEKDFELYINQISKYASKDVFNIEDYRQRKNEYLKFGNNRYKSALRSIKYVFVCLIIIWSLLSIVSFVGYPSISEHNAFAGISFPIAIYVAVEHKKFEYVPSKLRSWLNPALFAVVCSAPSYLSYNYEVYSQLAVSLFY